MIVAALDSVTTTQGTPDGAVEARVVAAPSPLVVTGDTVTADITYDSALASAALPGTALQVIVGLRVTINGVELPPSRMLPGASVHRALDGLSTFSIPVVLRSEWPDSYDYPAGHPESYMGPPPGGALIDIDGVYLTASGPRSVRLVTGGVVDNCVETFDQEDSYVLNGTDAGGRAERRLVSLSLPAGHGLARRQVVGRIAAAASVDDVALEASGRVDKAVQLAESEWLQVAREMMLASGRTLTWDRYGTLVDPPRVRRDLDYDLILREEDLLSARRNSSADGPTRIVVTGERQITKEDCGRVTTIQFVEAFADYRRVEASFTQDGTGALTGLGAQQQSFVQLVSRVTTVKESECDRPLSELVVTEGFHNPSTWRYEQDTGSDFSIKAYNPNAFIVDSGALADDGNLAFAWRTERFGTIGASLTRYIYDDDGFEIRREQITGGYQQRRAPVKEHDTSPLPPPAWEAEDFIEDQAVLGNGEGVQDLTERYVGPLYSVTRNSSTGGVPVVRYRGGLGSGDDPPVEKVIHTNIIEKTYGADGALLGGFRRGEKDETYAWGYRLRRGGSVPYYLYKDGESPDVAETFALRGTETVGYIPEEGDGSHASLTTRRDGEGRLLPRESSPIVYEAGLEGYLPAAERSTPIEPTGYENGLPASDRESQPIECDYRVPVPAGIREPWTQRIHNPWAESEAELCQIAADEASLAWAFRVSATIPQCYALFEGMVVLVILRRAGLYAAVHVKSVTHTLPVVRDYASTQFDGDQYVV